MRARLLWALASWLGCGGDGGPAREDDAAIPEDAGPDCCAEDAGSDAGSTDLCDDDGDCAAGTRCLDDRQCGFPPLLQESQLDEVDLGTLAIAGLVSDVVTIEVPPDAISVTINAVQDEGEEPLVLGFDEVTQPDGAVILDADELLSRVDQPLRNFAYPGIGVQTLLIPNAGEDRLRIQAGTYSFTCTSEPIVNGGPWPDTVARLNAWVKRAGDGRPRSGTIDLDVYLLDERLTAATAPEDARLAEAFATADAIWGAVGLRLGDVAFHDPPADDALRLSRIDSTIGPDAELAELYRLSRESTGRRLDLFLVRRLSGVLGIAGGVPGPALLHGTGRSGVAVVDEEEFATAEQTGGILAHEVGHYLGLYHSTEDPAGGTLFPDDPLADTTTGDLENLMYFQSLNSARALSSDQGFVLLGNPLVR